MRSPRLRCAIMILNWNGAKLLPQCLPSILTAAGRYGAEVIVVDNVSSDSSAEICRTQFPEVRFLALEVNHILAGYNIAATLCGQDILVFLNNDLTVDEDFLAPLLSHFDTDPEVYAVACCLKSYPPGPEARIEEAANAPVWEKGMLRAMPRDASHSTPTLYVSGGASAHRRTQFLELGGFDRLYKFYHEDVDLSWRAWKRGWKCLYEPRAVVYHMGGQSIGRAEKVRITMLRNEFLFHWKNLTHPGWILAHLLTTPLRLLTALLRNDRARLLGFGQALVRIIPLLKSRKQAKSGFRLDDKEAFHRVNGQEALSAPVQWEQA